MYEIGDLFAHTDPNGSVEVYILANCGNGYGPRLICMTTGNRWADCRTSFEYEISADHFFEITNHKPNQFKRISREEALIYMQEGLKPNWEV